MYTQYPLNTSSCVSVFVVSHENPSLLAGLITIAALGNAFFTSICSDIQLLPSCEMRGDTPIKFHPGATGDRSQISSGSITDGYGVVD